MKTMKIVMETERLLLRAWSSTDAEAFFKLSQDDGFNQFSITKYRQPSLSEAKAWVERAEAYFGKHGIGVWSIIRREDEALIGICGLRYYPDPETRGDVEVTYRLLESAWGKGYGTEAALASMDYGFSKSKLPEIIAVIDPKNEPSKTVIRKLGMSYQGDEFYKGTVLVGRYAKKAHHPLSALSPQRDQ